MITLTDEEKKKFELWAIMNFSDFDVPSDEGNVDALLYNLVQTIRGNDTRYSYLEHQDQLILELRNEAEGIQVIDNTV